MLADHRRKLVKADFACLFRKPLISVVVLRRAYGKVESVWMASPVLGLLKYHRLHALVTVRGDTATVESAATVDYGDLVSTSVSEYLYAVTGFVMVKSADSAFDIARKEKFHLMSYYNAKIM